MAAMKILPWALLALAAVGCGGSSSPGDRLVGSWLFSDTTGPGALGLNFTDDGRYVLMSLILTSNVAANAQAEKGTYTATANSFTLIPSEWSCPGPDPASTSTYSFSGSNLVVSDSSGFVIFTPNNETATGSAVVTIGCFAGDGTFTARPLAAVSN